MEPSVLSQIIALLERVDKRDLIAALEQSASHDSFKGAGGKSVGNGCGVVEADGSGAVVARDLADVVGVDAFAVDASARGVDSESEGSVTWSDIMDEVDGMQEKAAVAIPSVVMPEYSYCDAVKGVNFLSPREQAPSGFQATYVRSPANKAYLAALLAVGVKLPRSCHAELALTRYTAGTMPVAFHAGRERLKALALVGDRAMALVLMDKAYSKSESAAELQRKAASLLTVVHLSKVFVNSGWAKHVSFPPGVEPLATKPAGEACEAVCGVIYHGCGLAGVAKFMAALQLL